MKFKILIFVLFCTLAVNAQNKNDLVQFSGVVLDTDSLNPLPYTSILIKHTHRGTITDYFGYFSFVAQKNDTILFHSVGYKTAEFVIPDTLTNDRYSLIQVLIKDTIQLEEAKVYPWPSVEQFKQAFLNLKIPEDDYERAMKNLAREEILKRAEAMPMDGSLNYKYAMQQWQSKLYYAGQAPPISILNPIAWAQFIRAWKNGEFKKK
ncbi:MAG: carboxypeptidase-like regulatory domain-containing protein [Bacteroidetes bacterium]|nr:MAG: carboxypeptidase-like regulatory domain-containing protein [Bacteroidota bacterium]